MQSSRFVIGVIGGAAAVVALGALGTHLLSGTESTTRLDKDSTVSVDGHKALSAAIVAGRAQSRYHPFPCCLLYTSPSPRDGLLSRMPSSA